MAVFVSFVKWDSIGAESRRCHCVLWSEGRALLSRASQSSNWDLETWRGHGEGAESQESSVELFGDSSGANFTYIYYKKEPFIETYSDVMWQFLLSILRC